MGQHMSLTPCEVLEKTKELIPRKLPDRKTDGQKAGQTLIHRTLPGSKKPSFYC